MEMAVGVVAAGVTGQPEKIGSHRHGARNNKAIRKKASGKREIAHRGLGVGEDARICIIVAATNNARLQQPSNQRGRRKPPTSGEKGAHWLLRLPWMHIALGLKHSGPS